MTKSFDKKVVVVSGGSRGIGLGVATAFAAEGAHTVLVALNEANLVAAADDIEKSGANRPVICATDLRNETGCAIVLALVTERYDRCDVLVNCAGATKAGLFLEQSEDIWQDGFALKFFGCVRLSRMLWPYLRDAKGHLINVIGGAARTPDAEFLIGGSVNAAMNNFTKGLAGLGKVDGVNVNAILPGLTETERVRQIFEQRAAASGKTTDEVKAELIAQDGLSRLGRPDDVAALATFLCSEDARHIQGTAIAVDGGSTKGMY